MCGGHGLHRLIGLATAEVSAPAKGEPYDSHIDKTPIDIHDEVKLMYARGEIGSKAFRRLLDMAEAGELRIQDLKAFQLRHMDTPGESGRAQVQGGESGLAYSNHLQQQQTYLEAACAETEESMRRLQLESISLDEEAETGDVNLEARFRALSRAESIEQRMTLIKESLSHLKTQLSAVAAQQRLLER